MKAYGGVDVWLHSFLTFTLNGGEWLLSGLGRYKPPWAKLNKGLAGRQVSLEALEKRFTRSCLEAHHVTVRH
jgi:hypothetical protein